MRYDDDELVMTASYQRIDLDAGLTVNARASTRSGVNLTYEFFVTEELYEYLDADGDIDYIIEVEFDGKLYSQMKDINESVVDVSILDFEIVSDNYRVSKEEADSIERKVKDYAANSLRFEWMV